MPSRLLVCVLAFGLLRVLDAVLPPSPEELVRRGNAAYAREEYGPAAAWYEQAERLITDPGLAAYNKAAALYRAGRLRDAEVHYRCCLSDATGARRAGALYGLGNALVQQSPDRGASVLREAVRSYEACLRLDGIDADLAADARHNLELARLLLAQAPPRSDDPRDRRDESDDPPRRPERPRAPDPDMGTPGMGTPDPHGDKQPVKLDKGQNATPTDEAGVPSGGGLPPVPDTGEPVNLSRADAEKHLLRAAERILQERRKRQQQPAPTFPGGRRLDW